MIMGAGTQFELNLHRPEWTVWGFCSIHRDSPPSEIRK